MTTNTALPAPLLTSEVNVLKNQALASLKALLETADLDLDVLIKDLSYDDFYLHDWSLVKPKANLTSAQQAHYDELMCHEVNPDNIDKGEILAFFDMIDAETSGGLPAGFYAYHATSVLGVLAMHDEAKAKQAKYHAENFVVVKKTRKVAADGSEEVHYRVAKSDWEAQVAELMEDGEDEDDATEYALGILQQKCKVDRIYFEQEFNEIQESFNTVVTVSK